ncbi:MAG: UDP-N-acetylmuramoyl-tripeptide--D-alanyl-D-alanine ligase [Gemmatimonadaceae bacterium]
MSFWTLGRLAHALADELVGAAPTAEAPLGRVVTDTRAIAPGDVFVALIGERFDAHDFLETAVQEGASALVVSDAARAARLGVPLFVVPDTRSALGALGRYRRRAWGGPVVAVAGSNGKTTTKALITAALSATLEVHATTGNLNNQVGVPLTLLAIPDEAQVAVVEIGTNHPGEVATLRALAEPNVAVVTSIGEEHLEGLGTLDGVLREECAVFTDVPIAITPAGQPEVGRMAREAMAHVVEAGTDAGDVHADGWGVGPDGRGWFSLGDVRVTLPLLGAHNVRNAMLAVAVARTCGVSDAASAAGMAHMAQLSMRSTLMSVGDLLVLHDAYNANPASAREALAMLDALDPARPHVAVLGSMLELGLHSDAMHEEIARRALASSASVIAGTGEFVRAFATVAPNDTRVLTAADAEALWPTLRSSIAPNAIILLKGSRGARLERLMPYLRKHAGLPETE